MALSLSHTVRAVAAAALAAVLVFAAAVRADEPADAARIAELIQQLGDDNYFVRERAQELLAAYGHAAYDQLAAAEEHDDVEIAARVRYLLRLLRVEWTRADDPPEVKRLLRDYPQLDDDRRLKRIEQLARLGEGQGVAALCRLVRYESSQRVSKRAALAVWELPVPAGEAAARRKEVILRELGQSPRTAAGWLRTALAASDEPSQTAAALAPLIEAELAVLDEAPEETQPEFVQTLLRRRVEALTRLMRQDEALAAMRQIVELDRGEPANLATLIDWLAQQRAFEVLDLLETRFAVRLNQAPILLYCLADARRAQGNPALVEALVERALAIHPDDQREHYLVADRLRQRGAIAWAIEEFRKAISLGPPGSYVTIGLQFILAELLHDQDQHLAAAQSLEPAIQAMEENIRTGNQAQNGARELKGVRARMKYFQACHVRQSDPEAHRQLLLEAAEADAMDADVLIALYRLGDAAPGLRQDTLRKIAASVEAFRRQIRDAREDPTAYNQLAWLVANTEGDQDEALAASRQSLELVEQDSTRAGFLDTLAHCHHARGEYAEAVRVQELAHALDPHSKQIKDKLDFFRAQRDRHARQVQP